MKLVMTLFRLAISSALLTSSLSLKAGMSALSSSSTLMESGTTSSTNASSESYPNVSSMCRASASRGPRWREGKASRGAKTDLATRSVPKGTRVELDPSEWDWLSVVASEAWLVEMRARASC